MMMVMMMMMIGARDGHADAMPIQNMRRIYRAISDICRIMRISAVILRIFSNRSQNARLSAGGVEGGPIDIWTMSKCIAH